MEDIFNIVNSYIDSGVSDYPTAFAGNWFLFGLAMFVDLLTTLVTMVTGYTAVRSLNATKQSTTPTDPINIYKWMIICASLALFLRTSMDAVILLSWGEVTVGTIHWLHNLDRFGDAISIIPVLGLVYLILRAGPVIEFQLLRKPIPTDLHATWSMLRKPVLSFITVVALSVIVTLSKY